jgi:hypothetical protein
MHVIIEMLLVFIGSFLRFLSGHGMQKLGIASPQGI